MNASNLSLTVLFAEVSGSVQLHEKLGSVETQRAVERCLKRIERATEASGGRLIKIVGAELMAVFDSPDGAFQAAVEMHQKVADLPPVSAVKLEIRVGFSHGPICEDAGNVIGDTVNSAALLAGLAKPGQVLINSQTQTALSPVLKKSTRDSVQAIARGKSPRIKVFELVMPGSLVPELKITDTPDTHKKESLPTTRLIFRYSGEVIILDERNPQINMGRDKESDVVTHGRRVSRRHARIERRGDSFVLVDKSTNGTYVTPNGMPESYYLHQECILQGKGILSFAAPASSPDADCAEFELL